MTTPRRDAGVLLLHGIGLYPLWNAALARDLRAAGWSPVLNWGYARHTKGIDVVAARIAERLHRRFPDGVPRLHAIGHSMGGLVIRKLVADGVLDAESRFVFLGTPHGGAQKAERFGEAWYYRAVFGGAGQDLRPASEFLRTLPAPPRHSLAVVGGTGAKFGLSAAVHGDNDGTVEVESARLPGVREYFAPCLHHLMLPLSRPVRRAVCAYLAGTAAG